MFIFYIALVITFVSLFLFIYDWINFLSYKQSYIFDDYLGRRCVQSFTLLLFSLIILTLCWQVR